jgi:TDG/mug DNA glycosylase family protein
MPRLYNIGHTNIVSRPTKETAELSKEEQADGTPILEEKVRNFRPEVVCCVGKSIWDAIFRHRFGRNPRKDEFKYGWQEERHNLGKVTTGEDKWPGARVFVATSTSGLAASLKPAEKEAIWKELGDWVNQRRLERLSAASTEQN